MQTPVPYVVLCIRLHCNVDVTFLFLLVTVLLSIIKYSRTIHPCYITLLVKGLNMACVASKTLHLGPTRAV